MAFCASANLYSNAMVKSQMKVISIDVEGCSCKLYQCLAFLASQTYLKSCPTTQKF
ncbi:hypothetical protein HanPSC8_Chr17g0762421 [Helianthus annuus]|nr:hypothetical protein HanPSC8_Chr17g0762421 [Helianthus annuus]